MHPAMHNRPILAFCTLPLVTCTLLCMNTAATTGVLSLRDSEASLEKVARLLEVQLEVLAKEVSQVRFLQSTPAATPAQTLLH